MVRTGVESVFGASLRDTLGPKLKNPLFAAVSGLFLAILFQSATAAGLLISGFAAQQLISVTTGIIALLGADLGSAITTRLLSFNLQPLIPLLIVLGTASYMATEDRNWRQAGRILVGIGLLLLSLRMIGQASEPLRDSKLLPVIVRTLSGDAAIAFIVAAVVTWLFHSSVAAVLLISTLAAKALIPVELGIDLVLGANFGGAMIAAALTRSGTAVQRAVPMGNLILRGVGAIVAAMTVSNLILPLYRLETRGAHPMAERIQVLGASGWQEGSRSWRQPGFDQSPDDPAAGVSEHDAKLFCGWLTYRERTEGRLKAPCRYRLPNDLEWSAAAGLPPETGATPRQRDSGLRPAPEAMSSLRSLLRP